jgi:hypothetical protein
MIPQFTHRYDFPMVTVCLMLSLYVLITSIIPVLSSHGLTPSFALAWPRDLDRPQDQRISGLVSVCWACIEGDANDIGYLLQAHG